MAKYQEHYRDWPKSMDRTICFGRLPKVMDCKFRLGCLAIFALPQLTSHLCHNEMPTIQQGASIVDQDEVCRGSGFQSSDSSAAFEAYRKRMVATDHQTASPRHEEKEKKQVTIGSRGTLRWKSTPFELPAPDGNESRHVPLSAYIREQQIFI